MGVTTTLINNIPQVERELKNAIEAGLEAIGQQAESHAKQNVTEAGRVDTGDLRKLIAHEVRPSEEAVYIGSNLDYAVYHELGTGKFAEGDSTGSGWWVYVAGGSKSSEHHGKRYDEATARQIVAILRSKGLDAHMTQGMKPIHFLRNAAADHTDEYAKIMAVQIQKSLSK